MKPLYLDSRAQKLNYEVSLGVLFDYPMIPFTALAKGHSWTLSAEYVENNRNNFVNAYELSSSPLKNLSVTLYVETEKKWLPFPLSSSPAYRYLRGEKEVYEHYNAVKNPISDCLHSNERFDALIASLEKNGYDPANVIVVDQKNQIADGQHRAAYLLHRYGEDYSVPVLKLWLVGETKTFLDRYEASKNQEMIQKKGDMGRIIYILENQTVPKPELNRRLTVELCENVHIHYRNFRFEFTKDEFLHILQSLRSIDEERVKNFQHSDYSFELLLEDYNLPEETYFDGRLQLERQMEGHYHLHYRNCRIEVNRLEELGFGRHFGRWAKMKYRWRVRWLRYRDKLFQAFFPKKPLATLLANPSVLFSKEWAQGRFYRYARVIDLPLSKIRCPLYCKEGTHIYKVEQSPMFLYLNGDEKAYDDYFHFMNRREIPYAQSHSKEQFQKNLALWDTGGYDEKNLIIVDGMNRVIDGLHRVAYLRRQRGESGSVRVLKLYCYWVGESAR